MTPSATPENYTTLTDVTKEENEFARGCDASSRFEKQIAVIWP